MAHSNTTEQFMMNRERMLSVGSNDERTRKTLKRVLKELEDEASKRVKDGFNRCVTKK